MLENLVDWLAATPASRAIQVTPWIIPLVQTIHILAIGAVIGAGGFIDLRLLCLAARSQPIEDVARRLMPWVWGALVVLLVSGIVMIVGEPGRSLVNPVFQFKMVMLAVSLATLIAIGFQVQRGHAAASLTRAAAIVSILLWIAIVFAGRWIAYGDSLFIF